MTSERYETWIRCHNSAACTISLSPLSQLSLQLFRQQWWPTAVHWRRPPTKCKIVQCHHPLKPVKDIKLKAEKGGDQVPDITNQITISPPFAAISVLPVVERPPTKCKIMQRHHPLQPLHQMLQSINQTESHELIFTRSETDCAKQAGLTIRLCNPVLTPWYLYHANMHSKYDNGRYATLC